MNPKLEAVIERIVDRSLDFHEWVAEQNGRIPRDAVLKKHEQMVLAELKKLQAMQSDDEP